MFDIVAPHNNELTLAIEVKSVNHVQAAWAIA
jgi:hypothetical protein